jgi:mitogen-activated protein kinase 1/3
MYGTVYEALDRQTGESVAIKRTSRLFYSVLDAKRTLREIRILRSLEHPNITNLQDLYLSPNPENFDTVIFVVERMESDLARVIRQNPDLQLCHRQYFAWELLKGLKYLHSVNVIHRDLKPANILLNSDCYLKICDFGLARVTDPDHNPELLSEYVATRWYRAPEILLRYPRYDAAIDVWSCGAIISELITGRPLFPGEDPLDQIRKIAAIIGTPVDDDLSGCTNEMALAFMNELEPRPPMPLEVLLENSDDTERDFISRMLTWNPARRITVEEALDHEYLAHLRDPTDEPVGFPLEESSFEGPDVTLEQLRQAIWEEVMEFRQEQEDELDM